MHNATIAQEALKALTAALEVNGSSLSGSGLDAIVSLLEALEAGLRGELPPRYLLAAIDPGMGKTLSVSKFLSVWKDREFQPASSVLVGVSRLEEINTYIRHSGLTAGDFGVLTSDPAMTTLGVPIASHSAARVLFTTHQMIVSRTRKVPFAGASEFYYQGVPRPLRVWDESLLPADPVAMRVDELAGLMAPHRSGNPKFAEALKQLIAQAWASEEGQSFTAPPDLAALASFTTPACNLARLVVRTGGQELLQLEQHQKGMVLVGHAPSIPEDFAPAIVLDASGRVRESYRLWERHRGTLDRLPSVANDYRDLSVHIWKRAADRSVLKTAKDRTNIAEAIADVINRDATSRWVIIHMKENDTIVAEIAGMVLEAPADRVHGLTWGQHHGTNRYADVPNIVIVSDYAYSSPEYHAIGSAASGKSASLLGSEDLAAIKRGEFKHNLLQAVCRASVRRSRDGQAGPCRAFIIAQSSADLDDMISETFPGCAIAAWTPKPKKLPPRVGEAARYIEERFADPTVHAVQKGEVRKAIGIAAPNFAQNVLRHPDFADFLRRNGLVEAPRRIERMFSPHPEGRYTADIRDG